MENQRDDPMLRLPPFQFRVPKTLTEAADIVASEGPAARLVAGGTDLWPNMKRRHQKAETVVSLMAIDGMAGISNGDGVRMGATTILDDLTRDEKIRLHYPSLARAVASISSPPLRNMGTIGGNVCVDTRCTYYNQTEEWRRSIDYCMKEEGTICWVATKSPRCWAHSASDSAPILNALGAEVKLVSTAGERVVPIQALFNNDGIEYLGKKPEEILTEIILPKTSDTDQCGSAFWKLRRRGSIDFAVVSVGAALWTDPDDVITDAKIYLGAVASYPAPATEAMEFLVGKKADRDVLAEAAKMARKVATPMDNTDFLAQWRGAMVVKYTEAALLEAAGLPTDRMAPKHQ